jgi:3-deoxy-D-manno-octulosonate 8-phosphate phosphatase KdsC-like HAD superfamily phosphatase
MATTGDKSLNLESINTICIDFHGVLTDGRMQISSDGMTAYETVHVKDTAAIRELIARGWEVYVVTSSKSPLIDVYCKKVGCVKIQDRLKQRVFLDRPYIAVGDSAFDVQMLKGAAKAYCPADAEDVVKETEGVIWLETNGGEGVVAELLKKLI